MRISNIKKDRRTTLLLLTSIYVFFVSWGYTTYLEPIWGYFGLDADKVTDEIKILSMFFCLLPISFLPVNIKRPSIFAVWLLYLFTYIPMVVGAFFDKKIPFDQKWIISTAYCLGMLFLCAFYKIKLTNFRPQKLPSKYFWLLFYAVTFGMLGYIVFLFRDNLTFANIFSSEAVYDIRFSGQEVQNQSAVAGHFIMWLSNAFFPFILSVGLVEKNRNKIIIGIIGLVILYMTMANKQFLFSILFLYLIYRLFKWENPRKLTYLVIYITIPAAVLLLLSYYTDLPWLNPIVFALSGIYLLRTVYTSTLMSVYYNVFFENHPFTYFSHISGINKLVDYPYERALGVEVGTFFFDSDDKFNANANFFITDGLSSIGLIGIPVICLIASFVFYLYDSSAAKNNQVLGILLIANSSVVLMNVSLFTTLISGGLLFFILLLNNKYLFSKSS